MFYICLARCFVFSFAAVIAAGGLLFLFLSAKLFDDELDKWTSLLIINWLLTIGYDYRNIARQNALCLTIVRFINTCMYVSGDDFTTIVFHCCCSPSYTAGMLLFTNSGCKRLTWLATFCFSTYKNSSGVTYQFAAILPLWQIVLVLRRYGHFAPQQR